MWTKKNKPGKELRNWWLGVSHFFSAVVISIFLFFNALFDAFGFFQTVPQFFICLLNSQLYCITHFPQMDILAYFSPSLWANFHWFFCLWLFFFSQCLPFQVFKTKPKNKLKLYHLWIVQKYNAVLKLSFGLSVQKHNLVSSFSLCPPKIPLIQNVSQSFLTMKTQPFKAADPGNPLAGTIADVIFQMRPQNFPCSARMGNSAFTTFCEFTEQAAGVYHREARSGKYKLTYAEAKAVCEYEGGHLATYKQLEAARKIGNFFEHNIASFSPLGKNFFHLSCNLLLRLTSPPLLIVPLASPIFSAYS